MTDEQKQAYQKSVILMGDQTLKKEHSDNEYYTRFRCQQVLSKAQESLCQEWQWKLSVSTAEMKRRGLS